MTKIHPAIAEHALQESSRLQAENETLRGLLKCTLQYDLGGTLKGMIADALSQQADHIRDAAKMVEPAPAQDEREAFEAHFNGQLNFERNEWHSEFYAFLPTRQAWEAWQEAVKFATTRPAQTEQQPVAVPEGWKLVPIEPTEGMLRSAMQYDKAQEPGDDPELAESLRIDWSLMLDAAPIAQTEQQPEQSGMVEVVAWRCEASKPGIKAQIRLVFTWPEAESFALHYEDRGCKVTTTALVEKAKHLAALSAVTAERDRLREEMDILWKKLDKFDSQSHGITALAEIERLRAEVEGLRKDAERITFIEAHWFYSPQGAGWSFGYNEDWEKPGATLRDAIDAAMAAKEA